MSIPSQSQSSPIIHFTNSVRQCPSPSNPKTVSSSTSIDYDSQHSFEELLSRPQSTPVSSPILFPRLSSNILTDRPTNENFTTIIRNNKKIRLTTCDKTSLTNVTPLNDINNKIKSPILFEISDDDNDDENTNNYNKNNNNQDRHLLRPPPLMVLSQSIRAKHPEQLIDTEITHRLSSVKDLPKVTANYSFVFYNFTSTQIEEAKRFTRRMGDIFTNETVDITTTHVILPHDDPDMSVTLDLILALLYGCRLVTFEWLKSSSRIGEWLRVQKFQAKNFLNSNPSLKLYQKSRQQPKPIQLFNQCGPMYLTSIVQQRSLLVKLITILGGDITVNRNRAKVIVGQSSKILQIVIYSQVNEQWVIDSIIAGRCLPVENYLFNNNNQ